MPVALVICGSEVQQNPAWALVFGPGTGALRQSERLPTRSQLASLLFTEAGDPLRPLRWSLSEIRRRLG